MNRKAQGQRVERLAENILKEAGWLVDKKNWSRFGSPDFFGQFDLVAVKEDMVRWIQVKSTSNKNYSNFYTARRNIEVWTRENNIDTIYDAVTYEVWLYKGYGKWRKEQLTSGEWVDIP